LHNIEAPPHTLPSSPDSSLLCGLMRERIIISLSILIFFGAASCSNFRKVEKSPDWRVKYEAALQYYEEEDYYRALVLFEQILPIIRGLPEGEKVSFYKAYCHFYRGEFLLSSHSFKIFHETYTRSQFAEEAQFMYAYSLYLDSPVYNLDQSSSYEAIGAIQTFINRYPSSKFREQASEIINEMQVKLEKKGYENAKQYLKIGYFKSAIVAFDAFKKDFPDSNYNEEIAFLKIKAEYSLAQQSVFGKQLERFRQTRDHYEEFIDDYPNSDYLKEAEKFYTVSLQKISELAKISR
ncbi:MAG: outer membrane protein assembly factor BamD, partial [Bacteroidota bacterium]